MSTEESINEVKALIPHREPFLFVDRILECGEGRIVTEREVRGDEPHFAGHYPGAPLMPGVLICEACFQTGAILLSRDAGASPADVARAPRPRTETPLNVRSRGRLPHWERDGATYFVTWRLADSLPEKARLEITHARDAILAKAERLERELTESEKDQLCALHTEKIEDWLNAGYGECSLTDERCASIVADTLLKFDGERYDLAAWCVMPNHVHVVFSAREGHSLASILHSWKSYTAKACNKVLGRTGSFWMEESFDRLVRDESEFLRFMDYTLRNPEVAGLEDWAWVGRGRGARDTSAGEAPASQGAGGAPATPSAGKMPALRAKPVLTRILEAKFRGMVKPGDLMLIEVQQDEKMGDAYVMSGKVSVGGKNVLRVKFIVAMVEIAE